MLDISPMLVHRQLAGPALDVFKAHRHEVPDIDADVDRVATAFPVVVYMPEHLQRIAARMVPGDHRIMAQRVELVLWSITDFGEVLHAVPWKIQRWLRVVIADDQMFARTGQLTEQTVEVGWVFRLRAKRKVSENPQVIFRGYLGPEVLDDLCIHFAGGAERALAEGNDVIVAEVHVGGVPVGHICLVSKEGLKRAAGAGGRGRIKGDHQNADSAKPPANYGRYSMEVDM